MDIGGLGDVGPDEQRPCAAGFDLACHTVASTGDQDNLIFHLTNVRQGAVASPTAATATTESGGLANPQGSTHP